MTALARRGLRRASRASVMARSRRRPTGSRCGTRHSSFDSPRVYLSNECGKPYEYAQHRLLGGSIRFTLDASSIGCNCIGPFYLSSMPAVDAKGARAAGTDSYCDAPGYNGFPCPEMDLVEANRFTLATTLHGCVPHEGAPDRWRRHADETYPTGAARRARTRCQRGRTGRAWATRSTRMRPFVSRPPSLWTISPASSRACVRHCRRVAARWRWMSNTTRRSSRS